MDLAYRVQKFINNHPEIRLEQLAGLENRITTYKWALVIPSDISNYDLCFFPRIRLENNRLYGVENQRGQTVRLREDGSIGVRYIFLPKPYESIYFGIAGRDGPIVYTMDIGDYMILLNRTK